MISTCFKISLDKKYFFRKKFSPDSDHRVVKINPNQVKSSQILDLAGSSRAKSQAECVNLFDHLETFPKVFFAGA